MGLCWGNLLLGGLVGKSNALLNVALEALDSSVKQSLLLVRDIPKDVDCLLGAIGLQTVSWFHL